jgi:hypothetical protein
MGRVGDEALFGAVDEQVGFLKDRLADENFVAKDETLIHCVAPE